MRSRAALRLVESFQSVPAPQVTHEGRFWSEDFDSFHPLHRAVNFSNRLSPGFSEFIISGYSSPGDTIVFDGSGNGVPVFQSLNMGRACVGVDRSPINNFVTGAKIGAVGFDEIVLKLSQLRLKAPVDITEFSAGLDQFFHIDTFVELKNLRRLVVMNPDDRVLRAIGLLVISRILGHNDSFMSVYTSPNKQSSVSEQRKLNLKRRVVPSYMAVAPRIMKRAAELLGSGLSQSFFSAGGLSTTTSSLDAAASTRIAGNVELIIHSDLLPYEDDDTSDLWVTAWFLGLDEESNSMAVQRSSANWSSSLETSFRSALKLLKSDGTYALCLGSVTDGLGAQALQNQAEKVADSVRFEGRKLRLEDVVVNRASGIKAKSTATDTSKTNGLRDRFMVFRAD